MISNPISIYAGPARPDSVIARAPDFDGKLKSLGGVFEGRRLVALVNDGLGQLAALATVTGDAQFGTQVSQIAGTTTAQIADLMIGNLPANAYVHGDSSAIVLI